MIGPAGLTEDEHAAMRALGDAWGAFCKVVGNGPTREADIAEACPHIHALQQAVMANAAARAHPTLYRGLGDLVRETADDRRRPEAATRHGHPMTHTSPNPRHSRPESHGTSEVAPDDTPAIPEAHSADTAKRTWSDLFGIDPHYGDHCTPEDPCQGCAEADQ